MAILTVGVGQAFSTIAAAVAAAQDGDVVAVQAGTYVDDFAEVKTRITIEGVGGMAKLVATEPIPNGKAILITDTDVTLDHLEFAGATVADGNGAGVRFQGGNLTITNSYFHDNQDGLLAAPVPDGTITISHSEFANNGAGDGYTHNLYVGDIAALRIDSSYFHGAIVGHEIKSRAETTVITNSRIQDEPGGSASYGIDLPNGGAAVISNDVIEQSAASQNPNMIAYGEEGNLHANSSLLISNDIVLNDLASPSAAAVWNASGVVAVITGLQVFGLTASQILKGPGAVAGTITLGDEPALDTGSALLTDPTVATAAAPPEDVTWSGSPDTVAVFRFFDSHTGTQFLTASVDERNSLLASRPDLVSEGVGFGAMTATADGATPTYRFFDVVNGTHFFTSSAAERDQIQATRSDLTFEGAAFYEATGAQPGTEPVYRFFDSATGNHFFTGSAAERAAIMQTRPDLVAEGVAFYAPTQS